MKLKLGQVKDEGNDVATFEFSPLEPEVWIAGQSIRLELPRQPFGVDERRFTIASAPYEGMVCITTRRSHSSFKQSLFALPSGAEVDAYAIEGSFVLPPAPSKLLFLAGGIGVTPFYAMLKHVAHTDSGHTITLLHSGANPVFADTIADICNTSPDLSAIHLHHQRLNPVVIEQYVPDWREYQVYVSGPEAMVVELSRALVKAGYSEGGIKQDLFTGDLTA